jgi:molybdopterin-guanine dinucleotide biosynthesis protein A
MGRDKATLPFGRHTVLEHVVETLMEAISGTSIVVVSAAGQKLPALPPSIQLTHDAKPARGPLEGMAAGLLVLPSYLDKAFVCSCDAPFVNPNVIRHLLKQLSNYDAAVPVDECDGNESDINDRGMHPLCAVYRRRVLTVIEKQLANNELRVRSMVKQLFANHLSSRELREFDPKLHCLQNMNTPHDYEVALNELRATSQELRQ